MKDTRTFLQVLFGGVLCTFAAAVVAGCGAGGYGGSSAYTAPGGGGATPGPSPTAGPVVHINFFGSANGTINDATFGTVSGFTQQAHAQVLGFSPGEQITVTNDDTVEHTLNVAAGAAFPTPGPQSTAAVPNGGVLGPGYQSGVIQPGQTVGPLTVTNTPGDLYIFCGIHFNDGMKDGIVAQVGATPGPQATTSGGGGCKGYGC
jgi:plastocyanin